MRINKYIAHAGVASRRKAEELIKQGLVTVNGQVVRELGTLIKSGDKVEVEGQPIYNEEKVYYLLNKPRGVISSVSDDKGRKTVIDLLPMVKERIYPVYSHVIKEIIRCYIKIGSSKHFLLTVLTNQIKGL